MRSLTKFCVIAGLASAIADCTGAEQARVLRLVREKDAKDWRLSVNDGSPEALSDLKIRNKLVGLKIGQGDVILAKVDPKSVRDSNSGPWWWIVENCRSNRVALYWNGFDDITLPVYHWASPFDDPRTLAKATFFREGQILGIGEAGFSKTLHDIAQRHPRRIFILGSRYDQSSGFGFLERPYEHLRGILDKVLKENNTELILLESMPE